MNLCDLCQHCSFHYFISYPTHIQKRAGYAGGGGKLTKKAKHYLDIKKKKRRKKRQDLSPEHPQPNFFSNLFNMPVTPFSSRPAFSSNRPRTSFLGVYFTACSPSVGRYANW